MAANSITQRIQLVGGDEIAVQFKNLGDAGATAFKRIQDAADSTKTINNIGPVIDAVKAKVTALSSAGQQLGQDFRELGTRLAASARNVAIIGGAVSGAVAGFALLVKGAGDATDAVANTAESVGLTGKELQELSFAAGQSGVDSDKLVGSLTRLNGAMGESQKSALETQKKQRDLTKEYIAGKLTSDQYIAAQTKLNEQAREQITAFTRLGIATHNSDGSLRNTRSVLLDLADVFHDLPNGAEKSSLALEVFGRDGARMIPVLNQGSAALIALEKESERVAPSFTKLQTEVGQKLNNAFEILGKAAASAKNSILLVFAPATTRVVQALTDFIANNRSTWIQWASNIADNVTPIINDLIALLEGRDKDVKNTFIIRMRDALVEFATAAQHAMTDIIIPALAGLLQILNVLATAFNAVFGTSLSGQELAIALVVTKLIGLFGVLSSAVSAVVSVIGVLVAAFGGVPVILAAIGFAFGFFIVQAIGGLQGLQAAWTNTWNAIQAFVKTIFDGITALAQLFVDGVAAIWGGIVAAVQTVGNAIVSVFQGALDAVRGFFFSLLDGAIATFQKIISAAQAVGRAIQDAFSGGGGEGNVPAFARGGAVRGAGTGTSDSILARVSNGEYVIPARAVQHFGVRFFDTIRRLGDPLAALGARFNGFQMPDLVPRFATGGLVNTASLAFASGGGGRPITLVLEGQKFSGLIAPPDVGDALERMAAGKGLTKTGRKPSWYGA